MNFQFSSHAIDRVMGRLSSVVTYAEVQQAMTHQQMRRGDNQVLVKRLEHPVRIKDETAINGYVQGDKVYAEVTMRNDGAVIDTVALRY